MPSRFCSPLQSNSERSCLYSWGNLVFLLFLSPMSFQMLHGALASCAGDKNLSGLLPKPQQQKPQGDELWNFPELPPAWGESPCCAPSH